MSNILNSALLNKAWLALAALMLPGLAMASNAAATATEHTRLDLTDSGIGFFAIVIFVFAYALVIGEEFLHLRKSKPVIIAAGLIWGTIGWVYTQHGKIGRAHV